MSCEVIPLAFQRGNSGLHCLVLGRLCSPGEGQDLLEHLLFKERPLGFFCWSRAGFIFLRKLSCPTALEK